MAQLVDGIMLGIKMKHDIYIFQNNKKEGPFSEEQITQMLKAGDLSNISLAWRDGMPDWQPLNTLMAVIEQSKDKNTIPLSPPIPDIKEEEAKIDGPKGIGGWLLFFCVGLTILGPLFSVGQMISSWEHAKPAFDRFPSLETAIYWETLGCVTILIYGFIVGCIIWSGNSNGKKVGKKYLLIRLFGFVLIEIVALVLMGDLPSQVVEAAISGFVTAGIRELVIFLIWWFYFKKSKRVRNTYG
jgi:hypothetical protein